MLFLDILILSIMSHESLNLEQSLTLEQKILVKTLQEIAEKGELTLEQLEDMALHLRGENVEKIRNLLSGIIGRLD